MSVRFKFHIKVRLKLEDENEGCRCLGEPYGGQQAAFPGVLIAMSKSETSSMQADLRMLYLNQQGNLSLSLYIV